jgi:hypothetical protein
VHQRISLLETMAPVAETECEQAIEASQSCRDEETSSTVPAMQT